jgi:hypothetical protein
MLPSRMRIAKHPALNALLIFLSLAIGLAALEAGGRAYATVVAKQGKLFRPDAELGWTPLPHLNLVRKNAIRGTSGPMVRASAVRRSGRTTSAPGC